MNITKEEVQRLIEAFHADPHTADWDDALSLLRAKRDEKDVEPVAYRLSPRYEDKEGYFDFTDSKITADTLQARGWTITPLFTHPAHDDTALYNGRPAEYWNKTAVARHHEILELEAKLEADTALLRMALEALNNSTPVLGDYQDENAEAQQKHIAAITALRERLGEVK